jgi:hypothetical protein
MLSSLTLHLKPCPPAKLAVDTPVTMPASKTPVAIDFTIFTISSVLDFYDQQFGQLK